MERLVFSKVITKVTNQIKSVTTRLERVVVLYAQYVIQFKRIRKNKLETLAGAQKIDKRKNIVLKHS